MFLFRHIFLTIFVFSLAEVFLLAQIGDWIGWTWTICLVVLTAMIGSAMLRQQGLRTWMRINERLQAGGMPGIEMIEGVLLLLGGALLVTPGFITDGVGFFCLFPSTRRGFSKWVIQRGVLEAVAHHSSSTENMWVYQQNSYKHSSEVDVSLSDICDVKLSSYKSPDKSFDVLEGEVILKGDDG